MAALLGKQLIGCSSHKLNLAVQLYLENHEALLDVVHQSMKKLNNLLPRARLRTKTEYSPISRNATRWNSTMDMVRCYLKFKDLHCLDDDPELTTLLPTPQQDVQLRDLMNHFSNFQSCTMYLQEDGITLKDSRDIINKLIEDYPIMRRHLAADARIVQDKGVFTEYTLLKYFTLNITHLLY